MGLGVCFWLAALWLNASALRLSEAWLSERAAAWLPQQPLSPQQTLPRGRIVFVSERNGNPEIYAMDANGSALRRLTRNNAVDDSPVWSPDGRLIAFVSERDGNPEIYLMSADGSNPRRLTDDPAADSSPRWSPDGERLLFVSARQDARLQIFSMNRNGEDVKLIAATNAANTRNFAPSWSPDGNWIAFTTDRDGYLEIYAVRLDGTGLRNLTRSRTDDYSPSWSAGTTSGAPGSRPTATPTPLGGGRQIGMAR